MRRAKGYRRQFQHNKVVPSDKVERINEIKYTDRNRNYDKCLTLLDSYLEDYPNDNYMKIYRTRLYGKTKQNDRLLKELSEILDTCILSKREKLFATFTYAKALKTAGKIDEAIEYYKQGISESDNLELIARKDLAAIYCELSQVENAIAMLEIPGFNNQLLNNERAKIYSFNNMVYKALEEIERPHENKYDYEVLEALDERIIEHQKHYIKGHLYYKIGQYDLALKELEQTTSFKTREEYILAIIDMVRIKTFIGDFVSAINLCEEVLAMPNIKPERAAFINKLKMDVYLKINNIAKAEEIYNEEPSTKADRVYKINYLLAIGKVEESEVLVDKLLEEEIEDMNSDYDLLIKASLVKYRLGKYEKSLELISKLESLIIDPRKYIYLSEAKRLRILNCKKLNIPMDEKDFRYSERQIVHYSKEETITHLIHNHISSKEYPNFYPDVDLDKLIDEVVELLGTMSPKCNQVFDYYTIKYENIGYFEDRIINQLNVVTVPGTRDIITMYPAITENNYDLCDEEEVTKKKTRRLSQIDKFNNRYGKK